MNYSLRFDPYAERQLRRLPSEVRKQAYPKLLALEENPRPAGVLKLMGYSGGWRIRIGDYRALFLIDDDARTVTVFDIDLRDKVYKNRK